MKLMLLDELREMGCVVDQTGSTVICDPPPTDTDTDYVVYIQDGPKGAADVIEFLKGQGYIPEGDQDHYDLMNENNFMSYRKDKINLILTAKPFFAKRHRVATKVCKKLNLLNKADRIMVFQAVLYGNWTEDDNGQA